MQHVPASRPLATNQRRYVLPGERIDFQFDLLGAVERIADRGLAVERIGEILLQTEGLRPRVFTRLADGGGRGKLRAHQPQIVNVKVPFDIGGKAHGLYRLVEIAERA